MKKLIALLLALSMLLCLAACAAKQEDSPAPSTDASNTEQTKQGDVSASEENTASAEPIYVGVLAPLTGAMAEFGKTYEVAMTMAQEEINAAGGINGRELILDFADSKGDQNQSAELASHFAENEKYVAILGDFSSGCSMAAGPIATEEEIVLFSPTASNVNFATISDWCFQIAGRSSYEGSYACTYEMGKYQGAKDVALFYMNNDFGASIVEAFEGAAAECGINAVFCEGYSDTESDFAALITKARAAYPDHVMIVDQSSISNVINQIRNSGWDVPITMLGPSTSQQVIDLCGENCEGVMTTVSVYYSEDDPKAYAFATEFAERAGFGATVMAGFAYDGVKILSEAIAACGGDITRQAIRDNLAATDGTYLTGPIKFTEDGDIVRSYLLCEIVDGKYVIRCGYDYANE